MIESIEGFNQWNDWKVIHCYGWLRSWMFDKSDWIRHCFKRSVWRFKLKKKEKGWKRFPSDWWLIEEWWRWRKTNKNGNDEDTIKITISSNSKNIKSVRNDKECEKIRKSCSSKHNAQNFALKYYLRKYWGSYWWHNQ